MAGRAFYFDDGNGRMVICLPMKGAVLMGTTEVETPDADDHFVADIEIRYLLSPFCAFSPTFRSQRMT